ncbi:hypothetical protein F511_27334 [Dorcoceras hygrometricum]|uniref:Uncharacterized protein n=1 Tax=Dorcoceras hygrometricum TaxID=472368 RepID=A0A2Z7BCK9_9LAMI|nr:hypothetical protein F511_27334 [Dorcoceras hygrometricum]
MCILNSFLVDWAVKMRIRPPEIETSICDAKYHCFVGREHCDVLSMQMDSDLVIYRTTLVRTFQVVTICRVDKSESTWVKLRFPAVEGQNCHFGLSNLKNCFCIIILSFGNYLDRSDQIIDRSYDEVTLIGMNRMFIRWTGPTPASRRLAPPSAARFVIGLVSITATSLKCRFPREIGRSQAPRRQQATLSRLPTPLPHIAAASRRPVPPPPAATYVIGLVSITMTRSFRPCQNPSDLLVQIDGGILIPVVDLIRRIYRRLQFKSQFPCDSGWSQAPRRQQETGSGSAIVANTSQSAHQSQQQQHQQQAARVAAVLGMSFVDFAVESIRLRSVLVCRVPATLWSVRAF